MYSFHKPISAYDPLPGLEVSEVWFYCFCVSMGVCIHLCALSF